MSSGFWTNGAVSIVLLPSGEQGAAVLERARDWAAHGLLAPALWVRPEAVTPEVNGPPSIEATVIGVNAQRELAEVAGDLFEFLAREPLSLVRLLKVRSTSPSQEQDEIQDDIARVVSEYVGFSMPASTPGTNQNRRGIELTRATLVCAPTEFQLRERVAWSAQDTGVMLVASPEDRASPWAGDAFVRDNDRFIGFVLMHICTVGGLWTGLPIGTLELFDMDASSMNKIWIPRVFVNGVLTDGLARRIAAQVLKQAADANSALVDPHRGVPAPGTSPIPDELVARYRGLMVDAAFRLDDNKLAYAVRPRVPERPRVRINPWRQLLLFSEFFLAKVAWIPLWFAIGIRNAFGRLLNRRLQGDGGRSIVGHDDAVDARDNLLLAVRERVLRSAEIARERSKVLTEPSRIRATPRLWKGLRALVFGTLDGSSDLSADGFVPTDGVAPVFAKVTDVLLDPHESWEASEATIRSEVATSIDRATALRNPELLESMHAVVSDVEQKIESTKTDIATIHQALAECRAEHATLQAVLLEKGALKYNKSGTIVVARGAGNAPVNDSESDLTPDETATLAELYRQLPFKATGYEHGIQQLEDLQQRYMVVHTKASSDLESYTAWLQRHEHSFDSQLLRRLTASVAEAEADAARYEQELAEFDVPGAGGLVKLRKRFHGRAALALCLLAGLAAIAIWLRQQSQSVRDLEWYPNDIAIVLGASLAFLLLLIMAAASYYRGWSTFERLIDVTVDRVYNLEEALLWSRQEAARLVSVREQLVDWLDIMSRALHQPWKVKAAWLQSSRRHLSDDGMPFAMRIAHADEGDAEASQRLQQAAARRLIRPGWRQHTFEMLLREISREVGAHPGAIGVDALDSDLPHSTNHARAIVRANLAREELLENVAARLLGQLIEEVQSGSLYGAATDVMRVSSDPLASMLSTLDDLDERSNRIPWNEFLRGALGHPDDPVTPISPLAIAPYRLQEKHHQDLTSYVIVPERIAKDLTADIAPDVVVKSYGEDRARSLDMVVRIDIAGPVPPEAIHVWGDSRRGQYAVAEIGRAPKCPRCGRESCPAADPRAGLACANSGI